MKSTLLFIAILFCWSGIILAQNPTCIGNRYKYYSFLGYDSVANIIYGQNTTVGGVLQDLRMDIYQPSGDVATARPLIILIHGGSFVSRTKADMTPLCLDFALRGYVSATIDYRLADVTMTDSTMLADAIIKGVADAKAAVRFFVHDAATTNTYRIDTTNIFVGGGSAGGIIASHLGYLDNTDNIPAFFSTIISNNGGFGGNTGPYLNYSCPTKAILNFSGALWHTDWIGLNNPPLFEAQNINDVVVPCGRAQSSLAPFPVFLEGGCLMSARASAIGLYHRDYNSLLPGHVSYFDNLDTAAVVVQKTADFLKEMICNGIPTNETQLKKGNCFKASPNPANSFVQLECSDQSSAELEIMDVLGRKLKTMSIPLPYNLALSNLANGVYYLRLNHNPEKTVRILKY